MALTLNTNSFVSLADAVAYFADRLDVAAWIAATDAIKSQALVTATLQLNDLSWIGTAISESQPLAFPRSGTYFDPRLGYEVSLPRTVPSRILTATYELAYHLLNNDGLLDDSGTVSNLNISSISLQIKSFPSTIPPVVKRIIAPLLVNAGANHWWRAN